LPIHEVNCIAIRGVIGWLYWIEKLPCPKPLLTQRFFFYGFNGRTLPLWGLVGRTDFALPELARRTGLPDLHSVKIPPQIEESLR
jgi:hypothetical protein